MSPWILLVLTAALLLFALWRWGGWLLAYVAPWLLRHMPEAAQRILADFLGDLMRWLGIRREIARGNLERAFPEMSAARREVVLRDFYRHLGALVVEFLQVPLMPPDEIDAAVELDEEGLQRFEAAFSEGKGAIVATAHFGNFELLGAFFARRGVPLHAVTKRLSENRLNRFWLARRRAAGLRELPDSGSIREILKVLRRGEVLAMMIDQNMIPRRAIFAPFFGVQAATTPGPAVLAERTGAPVFFVVLHRREGGGHRVRIEGPIPFERSGDRDADVLAFTTQLNGILEKHVREQPAHWYWVHRRWKTRPPDEVAAPLEARDGAEAAGGT